MWQIAVQLHTRKIYFTSKQSITYILKVKVKWSRYRPGVAQRVGRGIALLFHDRGTRRAWLVSSMRWPHFTPGKDPVPILQEAGWAPGPVWMGRKSRPHRDLIPDRPPRSQSLYWLSYPAHITYILSDTFLQLLVYNILLIPNTIHHLPGFISWSLGWNLQCWEFWQINLIKVVLYTTQRTLSPTLVARMELIITIVIHTS